MYCVYIEMQSPAALAPDFPSSPAPDPALIPPLLPLPAQVVPLPRLAVPPDPVHDLALARLAALPVEEALLERDAHTLLLREPGAQPAVQTRGRERRQRVVHLALLGAPPALERVRAEELRLRLRARPPRALLELHEVAGEVDVAGQRGLERVGAREGRGVGGRGRVGEAREERGRGEDFG